MNRPKYLKPVLRVFAIATFIYVGYTQFGPNSPQKRNSENSPFNELSVFVSVLEDEARKENMPLACSPKIEDTFKFADQWGNRLTCSSEDNHLYIKSAGPDGIAGNTDDLVLRRRITLKN